MSHGIYVSMSAAAAQADKVDRVAHRLANADTPGFVPRTARFEAVLADAKDVAAPYDKVATVRADEELALGPGRVQVTGRDLDVAPDDGLFLGVLGEDGQLELTRDGRLQRDGLGRLLIEGRPVVDAGGAPVLLPQSGEVAVGRQGELLIDGLAVSTLGLFQAPAGLRRVGVSRLRPEEGAPAPVPVAGTVTPGALTYARGAAVDHMVELLTAQRSFHHAMQALDTYGQLDKSAVELGRLS